MPTGELIFSCCVEKKKNICFVWWVILEIIKIPFAKDQKLLPLPQAEMVVAGLGFL